MVNWHRIEVPRLEGVLRQVLVVWVAQKQHEDAALHHDFGGKLHMQTCAFKAQVGPRPTPPPADRVSKTRHTGDFVSNSDSRAAARAPADLKACAACSRLCAA